jgi:hypothetical protein
LFGFTPALGTVCADLVDPLKGKAGTQSRLRGLLGRNLLVTGEVALSPTLLISLLCCWMDSPEYTIILDRIKGAKE